MPRAENAPAAGAKRARPRRPPGLHPFVPSSLDLEAVLRAVVDSAAEISGATLVTVWTADEDTRILERQAVSDDRLAREYPFRTRSYGPKSDRFVDVNAQAVRLARLTRAELLQRGLLELSPTHQPDGRSSLEAGRDWIRRALNGGQAHVRVDRYDNEALVGHGGPETGLALLTKPFTPAELAAKLRAVLD